MPENKIRFLPIPPNEKESPSWVAVIITLALQLYPISALLAFLRLRKMWKNHKLEVYRKYQRVVGINDSISIKQLSKSAGTNSRSDTRKIVSEMISFGYLGQEAYIDYSTDTLYIIRPTPEEKAKKSSKPQITIDFSDISTGLNDIVSGISGIASEVAGAMRSEFKPKNTADKASAAKPAEPAKPEPEKTPEPEVIITDMTEGEAALARLKQLNEDILDEEVSRKIDRIAMITGDIYAFVTLNPERSGEVRKFMNYYLPTTMKLLTSYSMLERQSYQGENIINARHDIEKILDTLVHAFEKQLDQLFATDAVDISSDISVLETMIAKDGLSQDTKGIKLQI